MAWTGLTLTDDGRAALNKAQLSNRMNFKSVVIGDGAAPENFQQQKNLVNKLFEITELKIELTDSGCTITADFPDTEYDYYFREVGVAVETDEGDRLYVYDNCGEDAQLVRAASGAETAEKRLRLSLVISDVENITVENPGVLYVSYSEFEKAAEKLQQNKIDREGGDVSDTAVRFEEAAELQELNTGEKLSALFGKLKLAVKNVIAVGRLLGNTDISKIGGGTVTGAISEMYTDLGGFKLQKVSTLPPDAASHPDTLYIIPG